MCTASIGLTQERGRTDGPEGSEFGKGGYSGASDDLFTAEARFGAAISDLGNEAPIFFGLSLNYFVDYALSLEFSGNYLVESESGNILVGPRLRSGGSPLGLTGALKAGPYFLKGGSTRFALSPQVGVEVDASEKIVFGLHYAADIVFVPGSAELVNRVFMGLGYRF